MEKLKETFEFLRKSTNNTIEVWDLEKEVKVKDSGFRPDTSSYDAFRAEIKQLVNTYGKIGLQRLQKNGSSKLRNYPMQHVSFKKNTDVDPGGAGSNPLPFQHQNTNGMNGMFGNAGAQGLGFAEMGKLANFDEVKADRNKYQAECDKLKDKNRELETEILKLTFGKESKPGTVEKLLDNPEVLTQLATVLGQAISKGGSAAQQLPQSASMNAPQLSQIKQKFISDLVQMDPDDNIVMRLVYLLKCYLEGNKEVINEFEKLYKNATSKHTGQ